MSSVFRNLADHYVYSKIVWSAGPQVPCAPGGGGKIIAGLLIGPCMLGLVQPSDTIAIFAEIGVVLLMFSTGLGTNLKELLRAGPIATLVACMGVAVPMAGGTLLLHGLFYGFSAVGSDGFYRALFIGQNNDRHQRVHYCGHAAGAGQAEKLFGHHHRQRCK